MQDIKPILVSQYEELSADMIYSKVEEYINSFVDYFPHYDENYFSPRKYIRDFFTTQNQELVEKLIDHSIKERNK